MHYYQHHIGDFIKDTANLNDHQLATYLRMLWTYYSEERPLGKNLEDVAFAMRSDEKTVGLILRHYFKEADDGWRHGRCDREIAEFHGKKEKAAASANARWKNAKNKADAKQTQCDGNADACEGMQSNENNGESEPIGASENAHRMQPHSERNANASKTDANQEPRTNNQSKEPPLPPEGKGSKKAAKFDPLTARPPNASPEAWEAYCANRKAKRATLTENACQLIAKKLSGHPDADAVLNLSTQNGWTGLFPEQVTSHAASQQTRGKGSISAVDAVKQAQAERNAEIAAAAAGQAMAENGRDLRPPLDGEFWRAG